MTEHKPPHDMPPPAPPKKEVETFEDWWGELEGFGTRCERLLENHSTQEIAAFAWHEAYKVGYRHGVEDEGLALSNPTNGKPQG